MKTNTVLAGLLGTTLIATAAFAQSPAAPNTGTMAKPTASSSAAASHSGQWRASKLVGLNVYNQGNEKLGDISEVLLDNSGRVQAVVIGVGGFLGVGQRDVAVAFDKIKFVDTPVSSNTAMNRNNATTSGAGTTTTTAPGSAAPATTTGSATTMTNSTAERWYPDHAVLNTTTDELKAMPEFNYNRS
ncbi:PRC-barrel domain-containing protein [Rhodopseudomonas palustris]|uniref:PRC-barrel domain-containing protein n=1 Tax=Rhodopseudomonas palustris TaxID=1076 RepID=UPI002ACDE284|nr:PRC-barrel domain-containing protein [Rhodopseudomonas palustris]WQH01550.1 PRC-barrel domain-containing protein [Rhodopseudomonas palustris]